MTVHSYIEMLEEAEMLHDRFPDLSDNDVIEHVAYVSNTHIEFSSLVCAAVLTAYSNGVEAALGTYA